ncbi:MAG: UDP-2,4-diacetamido-2,4,6-trideoxy-beta-L-altropyranose hydrolase [Chloroflexota bacterium]|nr:UDP-2,4-diacetamido-2,4,6-trideoxy-beta-L-altropyranose hydrolase [Chloroflexota bacterium]
MIQETIVIRADASTQMGTGHVMRCLALAQAWEDDGGSVIFAMATNTPALQARLKLEGMRISRLSAQPGSAEDATQTTDLAQKTEAPWIVVDGYHFDAQYQRILKDSGTRLLFIDDYGHAAHYIADIVLNQNTYAHERSYVNREPYTRVLLGTRYVLLRREFLKWRGWKREVPEVARRVLVTLGGSDPDNVTLKVFRALRQVAVDDLESVVVVGGSNPHYKELQSIVQHSPLAIRLENDVTNMPNLMAWADVAVSAGGSTCWELAFMGLPHLILVLAENQRPIAERLGMAGVAIDLGWHEEVDSAGVAEALVSLLKAGKVREEMSRRGQQLVDGEGGSRVVAGMFAELSMRVRLASADDIELLFLWANDSLTRQASFNPGPILWEAHQRWFEKVSGVPDILLLIVELREKDAWIPIGQVRIDNDGTVSISLSPEYRGRRLAEPALKMAITHHRTCFRKDTLTAYIKPENKPSQKIFVRAGFEFVGQTVVSGQSCLKYVYHLSNDMSLVQGEKYVQDR